MTPPFPPPFNPNDQNNWNQPPPNNQQNPYQQNPYQQNPYQQVPPWQLQGQIPFGMQRDIPNAGAILALGIISIVGAFCYAIPGLICSIISLVLSNKANRLMEANPGMFSQNSCSNVRAGRICAIIGLSLSILIFVVFIIYIVFIVSFFSSFGR